MKTRWKELIMTMDGQSRALDSSMLPTSVVKALAGAVVIVAGACGLGAVGVRLNASPSLPIGLYVVTKDPTAGLVEFCPDEPAASVGLERGYRSRGNCPDGGTPLLKPVVATAGDLVQVSRSGLAVNGRLVQNTEPQIRDTQGRAMRSVPDGTYAVAPGTVWVASSYHRRSFDSRYFGPISVTAIRHRLRPLLTQ